MGPGLWVLPLITALAAFSPFLSLVSSQPGVYTLSSSQWKTDTCAFDCVLPVKWIQRGAGGVAGPNWPLGVQGPAMWTAASGYLLLQTLFTEKDCSILLPCGSRVGDSVIMWGGTYRYEWQEIYGTSNEI